MTDITRILSQVDQGNESAAENLLPLVYDELRSLAAAKLANEPRGQTLQATALVHEAYLRLVVPDARSDWNGRRHFFGAAAEAMRRILIERARRRKRPKHGGDRTRVDLDEACILSDAQADHLLALEQALSKLADESPEKAELVKLRYFAGLPHQDAAAALGISRATADRYWSYAKAFLYYEVDTDE